MHNIAEERKLNATQDDNVRIHPRLAIALARDVDFLEQRIAAMEKKG
jgi:hypothetical protein